MYVNALRGQIMGIECVYLVSSIYNLYFFLSSRMPVTRLRAQQSALGQEQTIVPRPASIERTMADTITPPVPLCLVRIEQQGLTCAHRQAITRHIPFSYRTGGGILYRHLHVQYYTLRASNVESASLWILSAGNDDGVELSGDGHSLAEAWKDLNDQLSSIGQCSSCGLFTRDIGAGFCCESCELRDAFPPDQCTVCTLEKRNMFHLRCHHAFCRDCVKRCLARVCPICRAPYSLSRGLVELSDEEEGVSGA